MVSLRKDRRGSHARRSMKQAAGAVVEAMERRQLLAASIELAAELYPGTSFSFITSITEMGGNLYIPSWSKDLFVTRGTQGTTALLKHLDNGRNEDQELSEVVAGQSHLYFRARNSDVAGYDLWTSNGTAAATVKITPASLVSDEGTHTMLGEKLLFAGKASDGKVYPWISDGTAGGTVQLTNAPMLASTVPAVLNGSVYFFAGESGTTGLYRSDGTVGGTVRIGDFTAGIGSELEAVNGRIIATKGWEMWVYNGSTFAKYYDMMSSSDLFAWQNVVYFAGNPGAGGGGTELWRTDGTATGTYRVKDTNPSVASSIPKYFVAAADRLYFVAMAASYGWEWWMTDGTAGGTRLAVDLVPGTSGINDSAIGQWGAAVVGNTVFFEHSGTDTGPELWQTDGTPEGSHIVQDLKTGWDGSWPQVITAVGNTLYFQAKSDTVTNELFKYTPEVPVNNPPVGQLAGTPTATVGTAPMTISIRWTDVEGVNTATLGNGDISVTLPNGAVISATLSGFSGPTTDLMATYTIAAPAGGWDFTFSGTYQVNVNANQVSDIQGQTTAAGSLGTFTKTFAPPVVSNPLTFDGTNGNDQFILQDVNGVLTVSFNGSIGRYRSVDVTSVHINAHDGNDLIDLRGLSMPVSVKGGAGNDTIYGGNAGDTLYGDGGDDRIEGNAGDDTLYGNFDNDTLVGGDGNDSLAAGLGFDSLTGGIGDDSLYAGDHSDTIYGNEGNDYIEARGKADTVYGGSGNDTIWGGAGNDSISGEDGDDWIDIGYYLFSDTVDGGAGADTLQCATDDLNDLLMDTFENVLYRPAGS